MSEEATAPTAAPVTNTSAQQPEGDPAWLAGRLTRERNAVLRSIATELGLDATDAAAALAAHKAKVTELAQAAGQIDTLKASADASRQALAQYASEAVAALPDSARAAVTELAGDDPAKQLAVMRTLRTHGLHQPTSTGAVTPAAPVAVAALPVVPPPAAPAAPNHLATHEALQRTNPVAAAYYLEKYHREIAEAKRSR